MEKKNSELTLKEIYHQSRSFAAINITAEEITATLSEVFREPYDALIFTGCGTSLYLAQFAAHAFAEMMDIPAQAVCCSELYYFPDTYIKGKRTLVLPITRKSYTTEVRMAIDRVHALPGVSSLAITCDPDSRLYNEHMILSPDADEKSVIMTGSFTSMVYLCAVLALYAGGKKDVFSGLSDYAAHAEDALKKADALAERIVAEHPGLNLFITLGQGVYYGIANECMNKVKEMGISNSEAYYTLEYRHGPMSLVDENTLIVLLAHDKTAEGDGKLLAEMQSYGAVTLAVGNGATEKFAFADYCLNLDYGYNEIENAPIIGFIGQFLGYYIAQKKGLDADAPRHLSQAIVIK